MKTLVIILLGVKLNYVSFPMKFENCLDSFMFTVERMATYHEWTNKEQYQGLRKLLNIKIKQMT